jgi:hypothetical protein
VLTDEGDSGCLNSDPRNGIDETRQKGGSKQGEQSHWLWRSNRKKQGRFAREQDQKNLRLIKKLLVTHDYRKDTFLFLGLPKMRVRSRFKLNLLSCRAKMSQK